MRKLLITLMLLCCTNLASASNDGLVWPPAPDEAKLQYIGNIECSKLSIEAGFFGKIGRLFTGNDDNETLSLPFDIAVTDESIFLTCQNIQALIKINRVSNEFKFITDKDNPFIYPLGLCADTDGNVYVTDVENKTVYIYKDKKLQPFITENLSRPTGLTYLPSEKKLCIVDTGDHCLKMFSLDGQFINRIPSADDSAIFHYPTFVTHTDDKLLVNDALNYKIRTLQTDGTLTQSFGMEGSGPGTFSRLKGIAVDSEKHIYVVDNLADNFQIFTQDGKLLLAVGSRGQAEGQFWSPAGIEIQNDTIYIADTFNNRIQIFHYLGDKK